jgi:hypothetical protein
VVKSRGAPGLWFDEAFADRMAGQIAAVANPELFMDVRPALDGIRAVVDFGDDLEISASASSSCHTS